MARGHLIQKRRPQQFVGANTGEGVTQKRTAIARRKSPRVVAIANPIEVAPMEEKLARPTTIMHIFEFPAFIQWIGRHGRVSTGIL